MRLILALCLNVAPLATAQTALQLPVGAVETAHEVSQGSYLLPTGRYTPDAQPSIPLEGDILTRAWRLPDEQADTLAVTRSLQNILEEQGFTVLYECSSIQCGGFDFRFSYPVLKQPRMEVDLGDFRFFGTKSPNDPAIHIGFVISRTERGGFVQATEVSPRNIEVVPLEPVQTTQTAFTGSELAQALARDGRAILEGVTFASGKTELDPTSTPTLETVVEILEAEPTLQLIFVGHSDNEGGLDGNIRISRIRAEAVRSALISQYGIAPERLSAAGAGYLSPLVPNTDDAARARNRRVEIVLR